MNLRSAGAALAIILLGGACGATQGPDVSAVPSQPTVAAERATGSALGGFSDEPIGSFSRRRAMRHVRKLASDIGVRVRATQGELSASSYIAARFEALGYQVRIQEFEVDGGTSRNVVAWWPDSRRYGVIVGGHMDTVPDSPGANDNASGTAVVLELARLVAGKEPARSVRFVAFGSEEYGTNGEHHVGSQVFVNRLGERGRNRLAGMVSVDMIADGRPLLVGNSDIADDVVARTLYRRIRDAGIAVRYHTLCDCSDHGPFEHAGIPASFAYSGPEPNYHDSTDTVPNMKPRDLLRTGRALRVFVQAVDRDMLQRFRRH
ncbi:MAG TPA: M28 family peptidase [Actinomycetota bacterium]|nr:M28 family peptidase [Actinomycetota bacterium]